MTRKEIAIEKLDKAVAKAIEVINNGTMNKETLLTVLNKAIFNFAALTFEEQNEKWLEVKETLNNL